MTGLGESEGEGEAVAVHNRAKRLKMFKFWLLGELGIHKVWLGWGRNLWWDWPGVGE